MTTTQPLTCGDPDYGSNRFTALREVATALQLTCCSGYEPPADRLHSTINDCTTIQADLSRACEQRRTYIEEHPDLDLAERSTAQRSLDGCEEAMTRVKTLLKILSAFNVTSNGNATVWSELDKWNCEEFKQAAEDTGTESTKTPGLVPSTLNNLWNLVVGQRPEAQ